MNDILRYCEIYVFPRMDYHYDVKNHYIGVYKEFKYVDYEGGNSRQVLYYQDQMIGLQDRATPWRFSISDMQWVKIKLSV